LDEQGILRDITKDDKVDRGSIEKLPGIITPGFVNAHCHLELSHLKNAIPQQTGLPAFARQVVSLRHTPVKEEMAEKMQQADAEMWNNGIVAVGDISNTDDSFAAKQNSKIQYHTFVEILGLNPANADTIFGKGLELLQKLNDRGLPGSLSPHAPYSTSKELIAKIAAHNAKGNQTLSIHNQESEEETRFLAGKPSGFEELYRSLGLDLSWYKAPGISSLEHYRDVLADNASSLLVHNTFTSAYEVEASGAKRVFWCFCPAANRYIENRLPDFNAFTNHKETICIGTDSLASNSSLDVVGETNLVLGETSIFSAEDLLRALTYNGAKALGISENYGQFTTGKNTGLNLVEVKNSTIHFSKKIA
jgi:cytosine/adenosine deaminase-related metal-dependent hydrolase